MNTCIFCRSDFTPKRKSAVFCSSKCRVSHGRRKTMQKPVVKALIEANPGLMKGSDAPPPATKPAPIVLPSLWLEFEAHCLAKGATPEEGVLWFKSHFGAPAKKKPDQPKSTGERYDLRRIKHGF